MRSVIRTGADRFAMLMNRPRTTRGSAATNVMMSAILAFAPTSCTRGEAARPTAAPTLDDAGMARCRLAPSRLRPLIVEWSGADRGSLELRLRRGLVAVRYDGCELEILAGCTASAPGGYSYSGFTRKHDTVSIHSVDDLYLQIPIGAEKYEATLARSGVLHVDMTLVGMYHDPVRSQYVRGDLAGSCERATHVISAAQVGSFSFYAGARAELGEMQAANEVLNTDGSPEACAGASLTDLQAPAECGAVLRLEFSPVLADPVVEPAATAEMPAASPEPSVTAAPPEPIMKPPAPSIPAPSATITPDPFRSPRRSPPDGTGMVVAGSLVTAVAIAGIGVTAGALVRADAFEEQRDSLPAGPEYDAANKRLGRAGWVALAGLGVTLIGGIAGIAMIVNGASSVRMSRGPYKKTSSSRLRVGPVLTRSYTGMDLMVRF